MVRSWRKAHLLFMARGFTQTLVFSLVGVQVFALPGEFSGFRAQSCGESQCFELIAEQATASSAGNLYAFSDLKLIIHSKKSPNQRFVVVGRDGVFDVQSQVIRIREVVGRPGVQAAYNSKTESLRMLNTRN